MRLSISQRVGTGLISIIVLLVVLILVNDVAVTNYRANTLALTSTTIPRQRLLNELELQESQVIAETLHTLVARDNENNQQRTEAITRLRATLSQFSELIKQSNGDQQKELAQLGSVAGQVNNVIGFSDAVVTLQQRGEPVDIQAVFEQMSQLNENVDRTLGAFEALLNERNQQVIGEAQTDPLVITRVLAILALLTVVVLFVFLMYTVAKPIHTLRGATLQVAAGDYTQQVDASGADEIGDLGRAFNTMVERVSQQQNALQQQIVQANTARAEAERSRVALAEQLSTIEQQRAVIRDMSVPILPLSQAAMVMPLVGALDSARLAVVQEQALQAIEETSARYLILDITGVPIIDTEVAQGLIRTVQAARLLGAEVMLTGIRPEVAQTIVGLGIHLGEIVTSSSLQNSVTHVLRRLG